MCRSSRRAGRRDLTLRQTRGRSLNDQQPRRVVIVDYDPAWPDRFLRERARIERVASGRIERLEHVGSTAVPGLAAKPTIDMMAGLGDIGRVGDLLDPLAGIGYAYRAEGEIPGWHYFDKGKRPRRFHLHVVAIGSEFWDLHLLFRDLLGRDRSVAREYEALKRRLAREFAADRPGYNLAKTDFIQAAERRARIERASGGPPAASAQRQDP